MPFFFPKPVPNSSSWSRYHRALCASDSNVLFFPETQLFLEFSKKITIMPSETFLCSISLVVCLYSEIGGKKLKMKFFIIRLVCLMDAYTSGAIVSLKTQKYGQNPFDWCPLELCMTKTRSCGSPQS